MLYEGSSVHRGGVRLLRGLLVPDPCVRKVVVYGLPVSRNRGVLPVSVSDLRAPQAGTLLEEIT